MENGSCPAEKTEPLLGSQETQMKQNGTTHVTIPPPQGGESSKTGPKDLLSVLKARACRWAVPSVVLNLILSIIVIILIIVIALAAKNSEPCPACPASPVAACPDGWIGYLGKCYYFSQAEGNWNNSQNKCFALGASLAGIDTQQEMDFLLRHKGSSDHWIGLQRERDQPWMWTNGTEFNNWFKIKGKEQCAFLNNGDVASSGCSGDRHWICSKPAQNTGGRAE